MPAIRQTNFSAGEIDPKLYGRTDLAIYGKGARTVKNFIPTKQGALVSRPGTVYVCETKSSAAARLVPFVYSDADSYVLEFTSGFVRFIDQAGLVNVKHLAYDGQLGNFTVGLTVTGGTSGATGVIVVDTDAGATGTLQLHNVVGTFVDNEAITDTSTGSAVVNGAATDAPLAIATSFGTSDLPNLSWAQVGDVLSLCCPSKTAFELKRFARTLWTYTATEFIPPQAKFENLGGVNEQGDAIPIVVEPIGAEDIANSKPAREWKWIVTVIGQDPVTGLLFESRPYFVGYSDDNAAPANSLTALPATIAVYPSIPVTLGVQRTVAVGAGAVLPYQPLAYNIYRGRGDVYGLVGQTKTTGFIDTGEEPNYAVQPPLGTNPFVVVAANGTVARTERPSTVTYFENRRVFGGTAERPLTLFISALEDFFNFDPRTIPIAGQALQFELAARRRETIRHMLGADALFIFTTSSVWALNGADAGGLDFDNYTLRVIDDVGSAAGLPPLVVEGAPLFVRAMGTGVRALIPDGRGYSPVDLSASAQHMFTGSSRESTTLYPVPFDVDDWCYAENPLSVVWVVRSDGVLLSLTLSRAHEVQAWARHETDGVVEAVCSVPRTDPLDSLREDAVYLVVRRSINGSSVRYIERMATRSENGSVDGVIALDCCLRVGPVAPATAITGLTHLEGESVYVISRDNEPYGPFTVTAGAITLPEVPTTTFAIAGNPRIVMHVGLKYTCDFEPLDVIGGKQEVALVEKNVTSVGIEVYNSRGLQVGPDFDHLTDWDQRDVGTGYGLPDNETQLVRIPIKGSWGTSGRIAIRQNEPLPLTIVGITREVEFGGS